MVHPLGDSNYKVQVPQNHQHPFSHVAFDADQATKTATFANSRQVLPSYAQGKNVLNTVDNSIK